MFIKLRDIALRWRFNSLCDILGIANSVIYYLSVPPFAPLCARQIDGVDMRALVDVDTGIIENYWGCILRQKVSIKLSIGVNFRYIPLSLKLFKWIGLLVFVDKAIELPSVGGGVRLSVWSDMLGHFVIRIHLGSLSVV